ncbi:acetoacetate decarboxylase family protein [Natronorubrum halophilum]|uniref:acetoacetate decarboxylase family protein n=1 Tax=Natronorubrum halophilum TaxID=1702106 RepID=UPI0010C1EE26|nr:acetoacetate decarboxylase family protein [Natronorubrum halophilum]
MHRGTGDRTRVTLSTGHEIALPLDLEFAVGGVTVPARRARLESVLPDELSALAIAPGIGCVTFVGIQYHRVGGGRDATSPDADSAAGSAAAGLEPYDEFAVIVPAVRGGRTDRPVAQLLDGEIGGYVHWLPVTTDPSVALGREIWGYPKERADMTVTDGPRGLRTVVRNGETGETVRLEVPRPRTRIGDSDRTLWSYTTMDGDLVRTRARIRGEIAVGTGLGATLEIDPDLRATLGCRTRPIASLYGSRVRAWLSDGERVGS